MYRYKTEVDIYSLGVVIFEMLTFCNKLFTYTENSSLGKHKCIERKDICSSLKKIVYEMISLVFYIIILFILF
jgi:serine/threonine protein kinase